MPSKIIAVLLLLLSCIAAYSQKAYDAVYYTGSTQNITILFTLGNGYPAACTLRTTDNRTRKSSVFLPVSGMPDEQQHMQFYHRASGNRVFTDSFVINGIKEVYDTPPVKIGGVYYFQGKPYPFTLRKK